MPIADNPDFSNVDRENPASVDADFRKKLQAEQAVGQGIDGGVCADLPVSGRNAIPDTPNDPLPHTGCVHGSMSSNIPMPRTYPRPPDPCAPNPVPRHRDPAIPSVDGGPITLEDIKDFDGSNHTEVKRRIGKAVKGLNPKNTIIDNPEVLDSGDLQDRMAPLVEPHVLYFKNAMEKGTALYKYIISDESNVLSPERLKQSQRLLEKYKDRLFEKYKYGLPPQWTCVKGTDQ